ncbi:MAG: hypothetical protein HY674_20305 [Chloroflexi bacterium]|nr:hypothetical protein [Chloroflexota bacterium]
MPACCFTLGIAAAGSGLEPDLLLAIGAALLALGVVAEGEQKRKIKADVQRDPDGNARVFTLSVGEEKTILEPDRAWSQVDVHKWVTRGLIEEPQSFHVLHDGSVGINGEKIHPGDPEGSRKLEHEIEKRHAFTMAHKPSPAPAARLADPAVAPRPGKVLFKVRLDHLGHLMVECLRGAERAETGLRGLPTLIQNGLMLKPAQLHVDPLQRAIEIDGVRYECSQTGAERLQETLNARYAPTLKSEDEIAIEIHENAAAATGFDIHFVTIRAGARFEVKGHLAQEHLEILCDPAKCDLLQPGIVLKLSPPFLLIRRKRSDGGEEHVPELQDVHYRHVTAQQLQQILNHPRLRRGGDGSGQAKATAVEEQPAGFVEMRLARNPLNKMLLWLECVTAKGGPPEGKALSHHNVADLRQAGVFFPHLDVNLSLDNKTLSILNQETKEEETIRIDYQSSNEDLGKAGRMLTAALKPPAPRRLEPQDGAGAAAAPAPADAPKEDQGSPAAIEAGGIALPTPESAELAERKSAALDEAVPATGDSESHIVKPEPPPVVATPVTSAATISTPPVVAMATASVPPVATAPATSAPSTSALASAAAKVEASTQASPPSAVEAPPPAAPAGPGLDRTILALFQETDPLRIHSEIFRRLGPRFDLAVQEVRLSLPRVFEDRRFEVVSFSHEAIESILELRGESFVGFYLSHINEHKVLFLYACKGTHLEWGPDRCLLQMSVTGEPSEYKGSALLGLAEDRNDHFVFVVAPNYRQWIKPHERQFEEVFAHFVTVEELAAAPDNYTLIWPELPGPSQSFPSAV